ncbi:YbhB/YbcL family Raf kinase inhibitor-like protein [Lichenifustis flavocetrariae]|uniref:YbhB/YbcL family Raf kinase inhibitor-like protein n=1 Tax=Lichenifustis flavocetrariae TaxID=2949735 RepID=A0AA41Z152_9HYPH|nr:YbhB/YbcL family Raf kinase inhibitor-like protein [Lichenifustis flavocetrariae]MCW6511047.1 YbhB/YbcL family Raf kinase inhibitor-like protein [Lichenifustis flavocetrariae]
MLEHVPSAVGQALKSFRPGVEKLTVMSPDFADVPETLRVTSSAFASGGTIPVRFTEDGAKLSPPLAWAGVPAATAAIVLLVEDADSPTPSPLVHAIAWNLAGADGALEEGMLKSEGSGGWPQALGKNSFFRAEYLPPDPPAGHGQHHYAFQVFAVDCALDLDDEPGRGALIEAMRSHVLAKGYLIGTYERM